MNNLDFSEKIILKKQYFNSSVIALIANNHGKKFFVLEKRAKGIRQGGEISFPGGKIEHGEESLQAALRELGEELGICSSSVNIMGKIGTTLTPSGILVEAFLGEIDNKELENIALNKEEVEECILIPLDFFKTTKPRKEKLSVEIIPHYEENGILYKFPAEELDLPKTYHKPWKGPLREVSLYTYDNHVIWGITADIIIEALKYI